MSIQRSQSIFERAKALIPGGVVHEQKALEDGTRFVSCKRSTGTELVGT